jgi:hypothetical protein
MMQQWVAAAVWAVEAWVAEVAGCAAKHFLKRAT